MAQMLPFGWPCVYYIGAEPIPSQRVPAVCIGEQGDSVTLLVAPMGGGTWTVKKNVHHATDPWHETHGVVSKQCGSWDYCDGMALPFADAKPAKTETKKLQTAS